MKTALVLLLAVASTFTFTGCMNHNLPKDSYMRGVKSEIKTVWGTGTLDIAEAATGIAANKAAGLKP